MSVNAVSADGHVGAEPRVRPGPAVGARNQRSRSASPPACGRCGASTTGQIETTHGRAPACPLRRQAESAIDRLMPADVKGVHAGCGGGRLRLQQRQPGLGWRCKCKDSCLAAALVSTGGEKGCSTSLLCVAQVEEGHLPRLRSRRHALSGSSTSFRTIKGCRAARSNWFHGIIARTAPSARTSSAAT